MKAILMSIQPKWCELIANGIKTIEVRKTAPKEVPFKVYMYMTKHKCGNKIINEVLDGVYGGGKVIGEFICDWITEIRPHCDIDGFVNQYIHGYPAILGENDCLSFEEMKAYLGNKKGYDLHISDLKIYDKPKEIYKFHRACEKKCNSSCDWYIPNDCIECGCGGKPNVVRAPQSWQYVEDLGYMGVYRWC